MIVLYIVCGLAFVLGTIGGKLLAERGITSDNALKKHQPYLIWIFVAIALIIISLIIIDKLNLSFWLTKIFPTIILLYLGAYYYQFILVLGCFILGLLIGLELNNKRANLQIKRLFVPVALISCALSLLIFFLQPVDKMINNSLIIENVVMQTTEYTCAPAAIATLARHTNKFPELTEKQAVKLTKTTRSGTSTLSEIKAMEQLGLNPEYRHGLTVEELLKIGKPALLHVKEKNRRRQNVRFSHAVALLAVYPQQKLFVIGNPYYGLQVKAIADMNGYWFGEAVLVNL